MTAIVQLFSGSGQSLHRVIGSTIVPVFCDGRTRVTSSRVVPAPTSWPDAAPTVQAMTDWSMILGSSLVALVIVVVLTVLLLGVPSLLG